LEDICPNHTFHIPFTLLPNILNAFYPLGNILALPSLIGIVRIGGKAKNGELLAKLALSLYLSPPLLYLL